MVDAAVGKAMEDMKNELNAKIDNMSNHWARSWAETESAMTEASRKIKDIENMVKEMKEGRAG